MLLIKEDVDLSIINSSSILHFSSLSLTSNPARETVLFAVEYAKKMNKPVSYDPNYRPLLWANEHEAVYWMKKGLSYADIAKLSEEELELLTGQGDIPKGAKMLRDAGIQKVFITLGSKGAYYDSGDEQGFVQAFPVRAVDTTGCGDAFMGAILYQTVCCIRIPIAEQVSFANATAALCATKKGGVPAMPSRRSVENLLHRMD